MKRKVKIAGLVVGLLLAALVVYLLYIFSVTGMFRFIEPHFNGACTPVRGTPGAEDITLQPGGEMAYISSDDRRAALAGAPRSGAIFGYFLDAAPGKGRLVNLTPTPPPGFHPHGIGLLARTGEPDLLFVVNHPFAAALTGNKHDAPVHTIEVFERRGEALHHLRTISDPALISPNDVAPVGPDQFYVTNDHGSSGQAGHMAEDFLRLAKSSLVYYDGESFSTVDDGMRYANGVNVSRDHSQVFVAATTDRMVRIYDRQDGGALRRRADLFLDTGVDNIEVDAGGNLWVGAHPKLLAFVAHAADASKRAPSQVLKLTPDGAGGFKHEEVFLSDGDDLSASAVGARAGNRLLIGGVFDALFLDCQMK